jgi:hypothetical protein
MVNLPKHLEKSRETVQKKIGDMPILWTFQNIRDITDFLLRHNLGTCHGTHASVDHRPCADNLGWNSFDSHCPASINSSSCAHNSRLVAANVLAKELLWVDEDMCERGRWYFWERMVLIGELEWAIHAHKGVLPDIQYRWWMRQRIEALELATGLKILERTQIVPPLLSESEYYDLVGEETITAP